MPKYKVTEPGTGKEYYMIGESPPTEEEIRQHISEYKASQGPSFWDTFLQSTRENASVPGMLIGGAIGAPVAPPWGAIAGAGLGAAMGSQVAYPGDLTKSLKEGIMGAAGEGLAAPLIKGVGAITRPVTKAITRTLGGISESIPTGKPVLDYFRRKRIAETKEAGSEMVSRIGTPKESDVLGMEFDEALINAKANFWKDSKEKYEVFLSKANKGEKLIDVTNLRQDMHKILTEEKALPEATRDNKLVSFLEDFIENRARNISPNELHEIQKRLRVIGIRNGGQERFLRESIDKSWDNFGAEITEDVLASLKDARGHYKGGMEGLIENPLVQRLLVDPGQRFSIPYNNVISELFKPSNIPAINKMKNYLPPEAFEEAKRGFISNFFDVDSAIGRKIISREEAGIKDVINGEELLRYVHKNRKIFQEFFDEGTYEAMIKLGELAKSSFKGAKILGEPSWSGNVGGLLRLGAIGSIAGFAGPEAATGAAALAPVIALEISRNNGILKRLLLSQTIPVPFRKTLELGGKAAIQNIGREMIE
jgi:hypothetical protein